MAYYLSNRYKKYSGGGWTQDKQSGLESGLGIAGMATEFLDGMVGADQYGRKPAAISALSGAAKGAQMGMAAGPWGAAIGGVLGGGVSLLSNLLNKNRNTQLGIKADIARQGMIRDRSRAVLANSPELMTGYANVNSYAMGGKISSAYSTTKANGGTLSPLSSTAVQVNGPSHEGGGVQLPEMGAEVEGGETMQDDFVFSDRLGFADAHKKIARAVGKIEAKGVMSPERVNAIERLNERTEKLKLSQEYLKQMMMD